MTENRFPTGIPGRIAWIMKSATEAPWITLIDGKSVIYERSYGGFIRDAGIWANRFMSAGLERGSRVVILFNHSGDLYAAHCGALLAGLVPAIFAPPSPKQAADSYLEQLDQLVRNAEASAVAIGENLKTSLSRAVTFPPDLKLITEHTAYVAQKFGLEQIGSDDVLAILQYSSGTTGLKKGVCFSHGSVISHIDIHAAAIQLTPDDRIVSWLPLYHDMGFVACYLTALLRGTRMIAMSPFDWVSDPAMLLRAIGTYRGTLCWQPNFAYNFLAANVSHEASFDLTSMRAFINCSEPVAEQSHRAFLERFAADGVRPEMLKACYAMAENVFAVTVTAPHVAAKTEYISRKTLREDGYADPVSPDDPDAQAVVSSGRPLSGTSISILDKDGRPLEQRQIGEIAIGSSTLFREYFGNPDRSEEIFSNGMYLTGDVGYFSNQEMFVLGRRNDVIIVGGRNFYPDDIERKVSSIDGVIPGRCAAFGLQDGKLGTERLVIVAESESSDPGERNILQERIRASVSTELNVPVYDVLICDHMWLVKSTSGKISRSRNSERYLEHRSSNPTAGDMSATEKPSGDGTLSGQVLSLIRDVLSRQVGPFARGIELETRMISSGLLDSLSIATLLSALEDAFEATFPETIAQDLSKIDTPAAIVGELQKLDLAANRGQAGQPRSGAGRTDWHQRLSNNIAGQTDNLASMAPYLREAIQLTVDQAAASAKRAVGRGRRVTRRVNYRSDALNTDNLGLRRTIIGGEPIELETFEKTVSRRGYILGNSASFGIGATSDAQVVNNVLNATGGPDSLKWFNLSERASNLSGELAAVNDLKVHSAEFFVFISGLNDFRHFADFVTGLSANRETPLSAAEKDKLYESFREETSKTLSYISGTAKKVNATPVFCLQASIPTLKSPKILSAEEKSSKEQMRSAGSPQFGDYWSTPAVFDEFYKRFETDFEALCKSHNIRFENLNNIGALSTGDWLFNDFWHYSDAGHRIIAGRIRELTESVE